MKVLFDQGAGTLLFVPVSPTGRAVRIAQGSVTYAIEDYRHDEDATRRSISTGTATLDTVDVNVTATSGAGQPDPRLIQLDTVTGIQAGHQYLISQEDGYAEPVIVQAVETDADNLGVIATTPLRRSYNNCAVFQGLEQSATFDSTEAADEDRLHDGAGPFFVVFTYTLDGVNFVHPEEVWLSRYSTNPPLTEAELLLADPALAGRTQDRRTFDPSVAIRIANEDTLGELEARRIDPDYFKSGPAMKRAVRARALQYLTMWTGNREEDQAKAEMHKDEWERIIQQMARSLPPTNTSEIIRRDNIATSGSSKERRGFLARL